MASEALVQKTVWFALARRALGRATLFRTNSGKAWLSGGGPARKLMDGSMVVPSARPVALGLATPQGDTVPGLSDLTGYVEITITPDMIGRTVPVFTVIETKESGGGQRRAAQKDFIAQIQSVGGIAGFASDASQANEIIDAWLRHDSPALL